jgi:hypothetical protein
VYGLIQFIHHGDTARAKRKGYDGKYPDELPRPSAFELERQGTIQAFMNKFGRGAVMSVNDTHAPKPKVQAFDILV